MQNYLWLLNKILHDGEDHSDRTGVGTISLFGAQLRFDLQSGFPIMTTKRVPLSWVAKELLWMLSGDTFEPNLRAQGVDIWKEWADLAHTSQFGREEGDLGPIYGFVWRHFGGVYVPYHQRQRSDTLAARHGMEGVDQIANALYDIKHNPNSRRIIVSGWHPQYAQEVTLPPCHTLFQFKVHNERSLSCHLFARSIDAFLGLPFNICQYALMTHLFAHVTGLEPKELVISFSDVHIYKNHFAQVSEQLTREPRPLPQLNIVNWQETYDKGLEGLLSIKPEHLTLTGYDPMPAIKAPVAV